jgi:hypothetical protein
MSMPGRANMDSEPYAIINCLFITACSECLPGTLSAARWPCPRARDSKDSGSFILGTAQAAHVGAVDGTRKDTGLEELERNACGSEACPSFELLVRPGEAR